MNMNHSAYTQVVAGNNNVGSQLFARLVNATPEANVVTSPISITLCLLMGMLGAKGPTRNQMQELFGLLGSDANAVAAACSYLRAVLTTTHKVDMRLANSVFTRPGVIIRPEFAQNVQEAFGAELAELFAVEQANNWVSEKTNGKIPSILDQLPELFVALLMNAVYMKGNWLNQFEKESTSEQSFTLFDRSKEKTQMMFKQDHFQYFETRDGAQVVRLPLFTRLENGERPSDTSNMDFCVYFALTKTKGLESIEEAQELFAPQNLASLALKTRNSSYGRLMLPNFKSEFSTSLKPALQDLGMLEAFSSHADFGGMFEGDDRVTVSDILHKTFVKVDETGFEGAAVTAMVFESLGVSIDPEVEFEMNIDRPFVFAACAERIDHSSAQIEQTQLFLGQIANPNG